MPIPLLILGYFIIIFFFVALNNYINKWVFLDDRIFYKKLFWHSLFYRLIFVILMYLITLLLDPQSLPFEIGGGNDSVLYHTVGMDLSNCSFGYNFIDILHYYFKEVADWGFPIFTGIIYKVFGPYTLVIRVINCILGSLTVVYLSKMTKNIFSESSAQIAGIIAMLMPSLLWFCGMHLKETSMIFMVVCIFYHTTKIICGRKLILSSLALILLFSFFLFYFRTVLAALVILVVTVYFLLNFTGRKVNHLILIFSFLILLVAMFFLINRFKLYEDTHKYYEARKDQLELELNWNADAHPELKYDVGFIKPFLLTGAVLLPFPSFLYLESRQLLVVAHYQNEVVRNIMYFFAFLGIFIAFRRNFLKSSLIILFTLGYIFIMAIGGIAYEDRFQLPSLPFVIIFMSLGIVEFKAKRLKFWDIYLLIIFIAVLSWNIFKIIIRG